MEQYRNTSTKITSAQTSAFTVLPHLALNCLSEGICTGSAKTNVYTLQQKKPLRCIIDYCKSTIYFLQHNNMIYVFTSI